MRRFWMGTCWGGRYWQNTVWVYARERDWWCCAYSEETYWKIHSQKQDIFLYFLIGKRLLIGSQGRLTEKFRAKNKIFFCISWSGKGFWLEAKGSYSFCFEAKGCPRIFGRWGYVSLYKGCKIAVSVDGELSSSFSGNVGVHQGSALSPLFLSW